MPDETAPEQALGHFGCAGAAITPITVGHIHQTFAVRASHGEFVLQRVNPIFSVGIHANIRAVTEHLMAKGMATLQLVPTSRGELVANLGERGLWRLTTLEPGVTHEVCDSPALARAAGALVARFHSAVADLDHPFEPLGIVWHDTPVHLRALEQALAKHGDHALHAEVAALAARLFAATEAWQPLEGLIPRVVHSDLKFNNLLFDEAAGAHPRGSSLIDLDTVCRLPLLIELGDAWRSWCNPLGEDVEEAEFDLDLFRAAVAGYLDELELDLGRAERASLAHGVERISVELAARFAADALEECYFGWDPERFPSRAEHNLVRARGQLSLACKARESQEEQARALCVD